MRLDSEMVRRGMTASRAKAAQLIREGRVLHRGHVETRPAKDVALEDDISITAPFRFVSRGGDKLAFALTHFSINPQGLTCMDIGASTGGFTDCLLQNGAAAVVAIDTGTEQMAPALAADARVELHEKTNCNSFKDDRTFALVTIDVSFVSLTKVLQSALSFVAADGTLVALIKPQFEVGRRHLNKKGIVKDIGLYPGVIADVEACAARLGARVDGVVRSPIAGGDGNVEFLAVIRKEGEEKRG